jgi:hypothetical protein
MILQKTVATYLFLIQIDPKDYIHVLHSQCTTVSWVTTKTYQFHVDSTIASRPNSIVSFRFSFEHGSSIANIKIEELATGKVFSLYETENCQLAFIDVDGKRNGELICEFTRPSSGQWRIEVSNPFFQDITVNSKVISYVRIEDDKALHTTSESNSMFRIEARWKNPIVQYPAVQIVYVHCSMHSKPILNATVFVDLIKPNGEAVRLELFDNGLNADVFENDGVYSRYFSSYNSDGAYSAQVIEITLRFLFSQSCQGLL